MKKLFLLGAIALSTAVAGCFSESSMDTSINSGNVSGQGTLDSLKVTKTIPEDHVGIARGEDSMVSIELSGAPLSNGNVLCIKTTNSNKTCSDFPNNVKFIQGETDNTKTYIVAPINFIMEDIFETRSIEISLERNGLLLNSISFENDYLFGYKRKFIASDNLTNEIHQQDIKVSIPYIRKYKFDENGKNNGYLSEHPIENNGIISFDFIGDEKEFYEITNVDGTSNLLFENNVDGAFIIRKKANVSVNLDFRISLKHGYLDNSPKDFKVKNVIDDYKRVRFYNSEKVLDSKTLSGLITHDYRYNDTNYYRVACDPKPLEIHKTYNECLNDLIFEEHDEIPDRRINIGLKKVGKSFKNKAYSVILENGNSEYDAKGILNFNVDNKNILVAESNNEELTADNNEIVIGTSKSYVSDSKFVSEVATIKDNRLFYDEELVPFKIEVVDENNRVVEQEKIKTSVDCNILNEEHYYYLKKCSYKLDPVNISGLSNLKTVFKFGRKDYYEEKFVREYSFEVPLKIVNKDVIKLKRQEINIYDDSEYYVEKYNIVKPENVSISDLEVSVRGNEIYSNKYKYEIKENGGKHELLVGIQNHGDKSVSTLLLKHKTRNDLIYESQLFNANRKILDESDLYSFTPDDVNVNLEADPTKNELKYKKDGTFKLSIKNDMKLYAYSYTDSSNTFTEKALVDIRFNSLSLYNLTDYTGSRRLHASESKDFEISSRDCHDLMRKFTPNSSNGSNFDKDPETFENGKKTCTIEVKKKKVSQSFTSSTEDNDVIAFGYKFKPDYLEVLDYEGSFYIKLIK